MGKLDYAIMDVETSNLLHGEKPRTKFWGYYDRADYRRFKTTGDFTRFLRQTPQKAILHHANFDIIQLLLDGGNLQITRSHNGRIINCNLYGHKTVNTFSCFPVKLETILKAFGHKKGRLNCPAHTVHARDSIATRARKTIESEHCKECYQLLLARNYGDCVNGLDACCKLDEEFIALCGVSPLQRGTIASTGFNAAEKFAGQMPKDLRFLEAYRGGRVEVFDTRETICSKYDINSSYPASILQCQKTDTLLNLRVKTADWYCPFFAANETEMLLFPNGTFSTWIYRSVLEQYILPHAKNTSLSVLSRHKIDFSWLTQLQSLVQKMYEYKQTTESEGKRLACKFLLNSLYGRIGLKGESERARVLDYPIDGDDVITHYLGRNRWLCFDKIERESRSNFPYAAFITDNARGRLYKAFVKNRALYGDTDSVFSRAKSSRFIGRQGDDCGQWKVERHKTGREKREPFTGRNVKDYSYGDEEVRKGGNFFRAWTLKAFAAGKTVQEVHRERKTGLRKRLVLDSGETAPLII